MDENAAPRAWEQCTQPRRVASVVEITQISGVFSVTEKPLCEQLFPVRRPQQPVCDEVRGSPKWLGRVIVSRLRKEPVGIRISGPFSIGRDSRRSGSVLPLPQAS